MKGNNGGRIDYESPRRSRSSRPARPWKYRRAHQVHGHDQNGWTVKRAGRYGTSASKPKRNEARNEETRVETGEKKSTFTRYAASKPEHRRQRGRVQYRRVASGTRAQRRIRTTVSTQGSEQATRSINGCVSRYEMNSTKSVNLHACTARKHPSTTRKPHDVDTREGRGRDIPHPHPRSLDHDRETQGTPTGQAPARDRASTAFRSPSQTTTTRTAPTGPDIGMLHAPRR